MWLNPDICVVGLHEKVYFLKSGDHGVLVDCGSEATYPENIRNLKGDGVEVDKIAGILISHEHFDHIGAIGRARSELGCPVVSHRLAAPAIETGDPLVTAAEMGFLGTHVPFLTANVDEVVDEGDVIYLEDTKIRVYHIPGHTPGGTAYLIDGNLLVGDTIFVDGGIGWPDIHWGSCLADHRDSINKIAALSPDWLLPGHGEAGEFDMGITNLALEKIDFLEKAGVPSKVTAPAARRDPGGTPRRIDLTQIKKREEREEERTSLRGSLLYEFSAGDLQGFIRPRGDHHGLSLIGHGKPITKPGLCTLNLEHYCASGICAPFLPRVVSRKFYEVSNGGLTLHFSPTSDWPVNSEITYRPDDDSTVNVEFDFEFIRRFDAFEAFIASYFHGSAYIHTADGWERPAVGGNEQLFFARDDQGAEQVLDGRWSWLGDAGLVAKLDTRRYQSAILVDWDEESGWALAQMVDPALCPSISTNTFADAQDISLIGRDVMEGERVVARVRVIYRKIGELGILEDEYGEFLKELD
jgi:glyoxylase-like metal-dependent hydrolase (beta-lactamase superfamily II)